MGTTKKEEAVRMGFNSLKLLWGKGKEDEKGEEFTIKANKRPHIDMWKPDSKTELCTKKECKQRIFGRAKRDVLQDYGKLDDLLKQNQPDKKLLPGWEETMDEDGVPFYYQAGELNDFDSSKLSPPGS